jgi:hypothetical protein
MVNQNDLWEFRLDNYGSVGSLDTALASISSRVANRYPQSKDGSLKTSFVRRFRQALENIRNLCLSEGVVRNDEENWSICRYQELTDVNNSCPQFTLSSNGLNRLLLSELCMAEINPLDFWQGLTHFTDVADLIWDNECYLLEPKEEPTARVQIEIALQRLIERFVSACPFASDKNDLRCSPAFALLPSECQTLIVGIVFKIDENGTTYICYPSQYHNFWMCWFQMTATDVYDVIALQAPQGAADAASKLT